MITTDIASSHGLFDAEDIELFKEVRTLSLQLHPRLLNFAPGADQEPGMAVASFPADIEAEVDATFKRMYETDITVEDVVRILQDARDSGEPRRVDFYQCMLHGLMDEMRFVATYPPQELILTAHLFGSLIQNQVVDHIPLGIAVRYVLDALKHPPSTASFRFGVTALGQFQNRLTDWPQLAAALLNIPHISTATPELAAIARAAISDPASGDMNAVAAIVRPDEAVSPFDTLKASLDDLGPIVPPEEEDSDKILFIINNLAFSNLDAKVADMAGRIEKPQFRWFANYLVAQRVSIEPNNHNLYLSFLDALEIPPLHKYVLQESYGKAAALLASEKTVSSSTERTLLKNLGAWIGSITLARNKPIKHNNIAFKELLVQGYDSGRLIVAIPFVCKILEQCAKSRVFKPPNPWLVAILSLLGELYQFAELKLNLKFEIEVLCKSLNLDLKDLEPTHILRNRPTRQEADFARNAANAAHGPSLAQDLERIAGTGGFAAGPIAPVRPGQPQPLLLSGQAGYSLGLQDSIASALQALPAYIIFNPQIHFLSANPALKRFVHAAIDRAIREIIAPVVERSVTIAGISTRELVAKDFATEVDDEKLRSSSHLMVQSLAGSLALVTCKEPLRLSIMTHLRSLLLQNGFAEHNVPEQAVQVVANENLDLACSVVERVAMEKAIVELDESLAPAYQARRVHRERGTGPFKDAAAATASQFSSNLPDPLSIKVNGLTPQQAKVYEDFATARNSAAALNEGRSIRADSPGLLEDRPRTPAAPAFASQLANVPALLTVQQAADKFSVSASL